MQNTFSEEPLIKVNPLCPQKAFVLLNDTYYLSSKFKGSNRYGIFLNKGYNWNGANIPKFLWRIVGSQYNPEFLPASMVHDWLCENKKFIAQRGVEISTEIFKDILILYGVNKFKAWLMACAVRSFQSFQKGWN